MKKLKGNSGSTTIVTSTDIAAVSKEQRRNYLIAQKANNYGFGWTEWEARGWAIVGKLGFYTGWWLTKKDAIKQHCKDLGKTWKECTKNGDQAVQIILREVKK